MGLFGNLSDFSSISKYSITYRLIFVNINQKVFDKKYKAVAFFIDFGMILLYNSSIKHKWANSENKFSDGHFAAFAPKAKLRFATGKTPQNSSKSKRNGNTYEKKARYFFYYSYCMLMHRHYCSVCVRSVWMPSRVF